MWRSVRKGGDTKTRKSRRTIALPEFVVDVLTEHRAHQRERRARQGWKSEGIVYVFGTRFDTPQQAQVIRDQFRAVVRPVITKGAEILDGAFGNGVLNEP